MRFTAKKKDRIVSYLLEKIAQGTPKLSQTVAATCEVSQATVHAYLRELLDAQIIERGKRGSYALVTLAYHDVLYRDRGELESDTYAFERCLKPRIEDDPKNVRQIWEYAFSEMVNNVMDHSESTQMHVRIRRNCLTTEVMVFDNGIGIFKKIKDHFSLESTDAAISELFKGKLTTDEENHSGEGIFFTSKMMDVFWIFSDGKVFSTDKYAHEDTFDLEDLADTKGTVVYMRLSNATRREVKKIFDQYSDVDGGFSKTTLPLKNIFDTAPVSRSQAKRICSRLDEFREVDLDFANLDWMGQGFAHQVFVVYQREHPEVRLNPIHMNKDVAAMYQHVMAEFNDEKTPS